MATALTPEVALAQSSELGAQDSGELASRVSYLLAACVRLGHVAPPELAFQVCFDDDIWGI